MKKILITGASGFIGKKLIKKILDHGDYEIFALSRKNFDYTNKLKDLFIVDLLNFNKVKEIINYIRPNIVIHLAYVKNRETQSYNLQGDYFFNLQISSNIIEASRNLPSLEKFIFLGSCDEYGSQNKPFIETQSEFPLTSYGLSKLSITKKLIALYHVEKYPSIILRPSVVYGVGQKTDMFIPALAQAICCKKYFDMTEGEQYRDFIYIDDLIDALILTIGKNGLNGQILNITYGESYQLKKIAIELANLIERDGNSLLKMGNIKYKRSEIMNYFTSNQKAKDLLGWSPKISIDVGLKKITESFLI